MAKIEVRNVCTEMRADANGAKFELTGQAVSYNTRSQNLGGFVEIVKPGTFDRAIRQRQDTKFLLNHDANIVLGRTTNGTLELDGSGSGLSFRCLLNKNSQQHRDIFESVKRGDISQCSYAFNADPCNGGTFTDDRDARGNYIGQLRTLTDVDLFDCSAVTYPASKDGTNVQARAEARSAAHYIVPPSALVPPTMAELNARLDKYHLKRALELGAEIRSTHDFEIDDTVRKGTQTGVVTRVNGNMLVVETGNGSQEWHCSDCLMLRDASAVDGLNRRTLHCSGCDGEDCSGIRFIEGDQRSQRSGSLHCSGCDDEDCSGIRFIEDDERE